VVLLGNLRGYMRSLLHPFLGSILLLTSYDAFLMSLIAFAKSMLALAADRFKLGLELP
jgi:hypothetical protein